MKRRPSMRHHPSSRSSSYHGYHHTSTFNHIHHRQVAYHDGYNPSSNEHLVARLALHKQYDSHTGCVNTVRWNHNGTHFVSGSDDCHIKIWDYNTGTVVNDMISGHTGNVFNAQFMIDDESQIVSCAADGQVRHHRLSHPHVKRVYDCHNGMAHKLALITDEPAVWLSAAEDGTVRQFDRRERHRCRAAACKNALLGLYRPGRDQTMSINSFAVNPVNCNYFAVAARDGIIREFDRRTLTIGVPRFGRAANCYVPEVVKPTTNGASSSSSSTDGDTVTATATPNRNNRRHIMGATSVVYSVDGQHLGASFGGDHIYLWHHPTARGTWLLPPLEPLSSSSPSPTPPPPSSSSSTSTSANMETKRAVPSLSSSSQPFNGNDNGNGNDTDSDRSRSLSPESKALRALRAIFDDDNDNGEEGDITDGPDHIVDDDDDDRHTNDNDTKEEKKRSNGGDGDAEDDDKNNDHDDDDDDNEDEDDEQPQHYFDDDDDDSDSDPFGLADEPIDGMDGDTPAEKKSLSHWKIKWSLRQEAKREAVARTSAQRGEDTCHHATASYSGHRNARTVKEVNFFGQGSEYIISGSDDGNVFIWRRKDSRLINIFHGDEDVVNVVQGHPFSCALLTSGIEDNIKLWLPIREEANPLEDRDTIVAENKQRTERDAHEPAIPRRILLALLARYQQQLEEDDT